MKYTRFALVPLILVIIIIILFLANSKDDKTLDPENTLSSSNNDLSVTNSPAPTFAPNVLGIETDKNKQTTDTSTCGLITSENELKDITGHAFKKQNADLENSQSVNCKYVYGSQVIDFYLVNNGQEQYEKIKSDSVDKILSNDPTFDSFFVKNTDSWSFYLLDNDRFISGTMPQLQNNSITQEKLKEITERLLIRD